MNGVDWRAAWGGVVEAASWTGGTLLLLARWYGVDVAGWSSAAVVGALAIIAADVFEHDRARSHPEPDPHARLWAWRDDHRGRSLLLLATTRGAAVGGMLWFGDPEAGSLTSVGQVSLLTAGLVGARVYLRDTDRLVRRRRRRREEDIEDPRPSWSYDLLE